MHVVVGSRPFGAEGWIGGKSCGGVGLLENQQSKETESEGHTTPAAVTHRANLLLSHSSREGSPPPGWNGLLILG